MPVSRWIKGSPGGTQPRPVTHGCGTPCCKALSQGSRGRHVRLPSLPPGLQAGAAGRGHLSGRVLLPSLQMSSADHSWKSLTTCCRWGETALWLDGQGCAAPGCPPDPFAITRQGSDGPRIPGLLMLHPAGSSGGPGASACWSPLTQGCTPGLGV